MSITIEIYKMDSSSGKVASTITKKFINLKEFQEFYKEAKSLEGRNNIVIRNYDPSEDPDMSEVYDSIMMNVKNQPVYINKMEKK